MAWLVLPADLRARLAAQGAALEIGCGAGLSCLALAQACAGLTVTGHDRDPGAIARARALGEAAGLGHRLSFEVNDSRKLPRAAFDLVTTMALRDGVDLDLCLNGIRNALRPEGCCLWLPPVPSDRRLGPPLDLAGSALVQAARRAGFSRFLPVPGQAAGLYELRR